MGSRRPARRWIPGALLAVCLLGAGAPAGAIDITEYTLRAIQDFVDDDAQTFLFGPIEQGFVVKPVLPPPFEGNEVELDRTDPSTLVTLRTVHGFELGNDSTTVSLPINQGLFSSLSTEVAFPIRLSADAGTFQQDIIEIVLDVSASWTIEFEATQTRTE